MELFLVLVLMIHHVLN